MTGIILAQKDIPNKQNLLGQFFTPDNVVSFCLDKIKCTNYIIEPCCGTGNFLKQIKSRYKSKILAIELDNTLIKDVLIENFYDHEEIFTEPITFIGNPPYHTPALSLTNRRIFIK